MKFQPAQVRRCLKAFDFDTLFREHLGWDRAHETVSISTAEHEFSLQAIAQKRGFTVFLSASHRTVLAHRRLLRDVQRRLRKTHHEHILIHACETPRKQVWQWATQTGDGHRVLQQTSLVDVLNRIRAACEIDQTDLSDLSDRSDPDDKPATSFSTEEVTR